MSASFQENIIQQVSESNQPWVASLTTKDIAKILDTVSMIPHMKSAIIHKQDIAVNKGIIGENIFEHIIDQFLSNDYKIENVAKKGKAGDFMLKWRSYKTNKTYKIIIDVKNYKNTVPGKEVEKFYRDTNINHVDGGLLLSLHAKIVGISKIIEFKEFVSDQGKIPMLFINSDTPELIAEVIKMLFHIIEIRDVNESSIDRMDELALRTNELNDNIQMIAQCRETLQVSKADIERSLNQIMIQLMSCEYGLINKIKQINSVIMSDSHNSHTIELKEPNEYSELSVVQTISNMFSNTVSESDEAILHQIHALHNWSNMSINIPKRMWQLTHGENSIYIRFMKTGMVAIFPVITNAMMETIAELTSAKKIKTSSDGNVIKFEDATVTNILKLCREL